VNLSTFYKNDKTEKKKVKIKKRFTTNELANHGSSLSRHAKLELGSRKI
jgi:hypothetical protein